MAETNIEFVKAIYPYTGSDQPAPLPFVETTLLLVVEKTQGGWCRGFAAGKEGWFPLTYVKPLGNSELLQKGIDPSALVAVMYSDQWRAHITNEDKIYFVNTQSQGTTWDLPEIKPTIPRKAVPKTQLTSVTENGNIHEKPQEKPQKPKKSKYYTINGITFVENGEEQPRLNPAEISYVDHFWADNGDQSGFDIILEKNLNGKDCMKDMMEFFRERAALEEQYAKGLIKLSKSTLGDQEEGTLNKAWQSLKAELKHRSEAHIKFAEKLSKEMEKSLFEYKESQKKIRKEHQQLMEKSRKQVMVIDAAIEKTRGVGVGKSSSKFLKKALSTDSAEPSNLGRRRSLTGDDLKKIEAYNQAQQQWMDNMINACQDYEKLEEERSSFLKNHFLKYIDLCVEIGEASAVSISRVADAIDRINKKADREYFIKLKGTGVARPVNRVPVTYQ